MAKKPSPPAPDAAAPAGDEPLSFEQALAALQEIAAQLERGDMSLEQALALDRKSVV